MRDILTVLLTKSPPFESTLPFAQAITALRDLLGNKLSLGSPGRAAALATLRRVREEWQLATHRDVRPAEVPCPACTYAWVSLARASDHVPMCPGHPAYARLEAAADAVRLRCAEAGGVNALLGDAASWLDSRKPHRRFPAYRGPEDAVAALARLENEPESPIGKTDAAILDEVFSEWARTYVPRADSCLFCREITPLEARLAHLLACPAHPAAVLAAKLEGVLRARGCPSSFDPAADALLGAFTLRNTARDELRELVRSCVRYEGEWGYREPGVYKSRSYCEDPWLARVDRAEAALAIPMPEATPPPDVAADVGRLLEEAKRWRAALKALWRECRSLWARMGDDERGRSLIPERIVPPWKRAIEEAKELLGRGS